MHPDSVAADRCSRLMMEGEISRAASALISPSIIPFSPPLIPALRSKIPEVSRVLEQDEWKKECRQAPFLGLDFPQVSDFCFEWAIRTSARGSSAGISGWRLEFFRFLFHKKLTKKLFILFFRRLLAGKTSSEVQQYFSTVKLFPFYKKGIFDPQKPDPRPVGATEPIWRCATRALLFSLRDKAKNFLLPNQFAVGLPGGCECLAHFLSFQARQFRDDIFFSCDVQNAFNSMDRIALHRSSRFFDTGLHTAFLHMYSCPTRYVYFHDRKVSVFSSSRGVIQGDPLAMLLFSLGLVGPMRWIEEMGSSKAGIMPDFSQPGPSPGTLTRLVAWQIEAAGSLCGSPPPIIKSNSFADDGAWRSTRGIAGFVPSLISICLADAGLAVKRGSWVAWCPSFDLPVVFPLSSWGGSLF